MTTPYGFYDWSYEQRRSYEDVQRERDSAKREASDAADDLRRMERARDDLHRQFRNEMDSAQEQRTVLCDELRSARRKLRWALQFIAHKGLTADFEAWTEPDDEVIDEESFEE